MAEAFICDAIRTPFGRYAGALSGVRTDDLAAAPLQALMQRNPGVDWGAVDDVVYGCANQAGEDNRNVGRMALLLAGLPQEVPGSTVNRLCGSSLDAVAIASRAIKAGEGSLMLAGGVESMSRAPFVQGKATEAFSRGGEDRGHDHRLALRQSADEGALRHRFDARDRRERRAGIRRRPRGPGRVRAAQPAARRRGDRRRADGGGDLADRHSAAERRSGDRRRRRASARDTPRRAGEAQGHRAPRRQRHGRQRVGRQRRRLRAGHRLRGRREAQRADAARPHRRRCRRRRSRRASWASGRRRRCARSWRVRSSRSPTST